MLGFTLMQALIKARALTAPRPSVIQRPSGYRAQPTGSNQTPDTMCYGVASALPSLSVGASSLLPPTGSYMRLHALDCLRAPQRSRSSSLRGCLRSRVPLLPFSYVFQLLIWLPWSFFGVSSSVWLCGLFGSSSVTPPKVGVSSVVPFGGSRQGVAPVGRLH